VYAKVAQVKQYAGAVAFQWGQRVRLTPESALATSRQRFGGAVDLSAPDARQRLFGLGEGRGCTHPRLRPKGFLDPASIDQSAEQMDDASEHARSRAETARTRSPSTTFQK
jgi:hypothetical protein